MQQIKKTELQGIIIGIILIFDFFLINSGFLKYFLTVMQTNVNELVFYGFYIFKFLILFSGIFILLFSTLSFFSEKSFFYRYKTRNFVSAVISIFFVLLIFFILFEIMLDFGLFSITLQQKDELLHHSNIPNMSTRFKASEWDTKIIINSDGLRDDEIIPRSNYTKRILMLGDSFTWGWGVENNETFSQLLEAKLRSKGYKTDVINAGCLSYSPVLEYLYLREKGLKYKPDVVVLNFDFSDVQDDYHYEQQAKFDEKGNLVSVPPAKPRNFFFFGTHSLEFFYNVLKKIYPRFSSGKELNSLLKYDINYSRYFMMFNESIPKETNSDWNRTLSYIEKIHKLCKDNNIKFVLVTYPYGVQVNETEWSSGGYTFGFGSDKVYSSSSTKLLKDFSEKKGIVFIDMADDFKISEDKPLFFSYDGHFNKQGHKLASEILYDKLSKKQLL